MDSRDVLSGHWVNVPQVSVLFSRLQSLSSCAFLPFRQNYYVLCISALQTELLRLLEMSDTNCAETHRHIPGKGRPQIKLFALLFQIFLYAYGLGGPVSYPGNGKIVHTGFGIHPASYFIGTMTLFCGSGSSVGIATELLAGRSGDRIPVGARFSAPV